MESQIKLVRSVIFYLIIFYVSCTKLDFLFVFVCSVIFEKKNSKHLNGTVGANGGTPINLPDQVDDPSNEDMMSSINQLRQLVYAEKKFIHVSLACNPSFDCRSEARNELFRVCNFDENDFHLLEHEGCGSN